MVAESLRTGQLASRFDIDILDLRKGGVSSQGPPTLLEIAVWNTVIQ
ncbi:MAG: hypothetical protein ACI4XJ_06730 [Eubacteriales bacterium]